MKILVLCYEYPPIGGGGRRGEIIAEQMAARSHSCACKRPRSAGVRCARPRRVEVFRTASGRRVPDTCAVREMGQYCATSLLPTLRHIREWKPDVIHAHFAVPTGALAWAAHRLTGVPYVLTAHLGDVPGGVPAQTDRLFKLIGPLARRIWWQAAAATAVSSFVQELAERAYDRQCAHPQGIDLTMPAPPPAGLPASRFVGANPQKNPLPARSARALPPNWPDVHRGRPERLSRAAPRSRLANACLTGWLPAEVHEFSRCGYSLMPSLRGMPVAAIEALKHGLAIVASHPRVPTLWTRNGYRSGDDTSPTRISCAGSGSDETLPR